MKKKHLYLGILLVLFSGLTLFLFAQKNHEIKRQKVSKELKKALVKYLGKEEIYPDDLTLIEIDLNGFKPKYELLDEGYGCRFVIEGEVIELWSEQ